MHIGFIFNKNSSLWEKEFECNKLFAKTQLMYIADRYKVNGYIYLNSIYEQFGIVWNPHDENVCWIFERDGELELSIIYDEKTCDKIAIDISHKSN